MLNRTWSPQRINVAGEVTMTVRLSFVSESHAGLVEYLADLAEIVEYRATTKSLQMKHNIGIQDFQFEVPYGGSPYPTR